MRTDGGKKKTKLKLEEYFKLYFLIYQLITIRLYRINKTLLMTMSIS